MPTPYQSTEMQAKPWSGGQGHLTTLAFLPHLSVLNSRCGLCPPWMWCLYLGLYLFYALLGLARLDFLTRNSLCCRGLAGLPNERVSFGFHILMEVRLHIYGYLSLLLREITSCLLGHGDYCTVCANCRVQWQGQISVHMLLPVQGVSHIWPKGRSVREKGCTEFMFQKGVNSFSWGGDTRDREELWPKSDMV